MSYTFLKKGLVIFFTIYALSGFYFTKADSEVYPFFSWDLFSRIPGETYGDFDVLIHKIGTKEINPPIFFHEAKDLYNSKDRYASDYRSLFINLGLALKKENYQKIQENKTRLESKFLIQPIEYEVVNIKFNTIERFKTGKILETHSLGKFTSEKHE